MSSYCFSAYVGCKAAIKMLCDSGASIDAADAVSKIGFETTIHFARCVYLRSDERKGDRKSDFEIKTKILTYTYIMYLFQDGRSPLLLAAKMSQPGACQLLVQFGARTVLRDKQNK